MRVLQLTPLAKARVWFRSDVPEFVHVGTVSKRIDGDPLSSVQAGCVTVEAFVPRGGLAEYGLLGMSFERDRTSLVQVEVPYSEGEGPTWSDSLGRAVDVVRLGLPYEYAGAILDAAVDVGHRFPPGTIKVVHAAHGLVGSSPRFFQRLATSALTLMVDEHEREDDPMITVLRGLLVK
ncbi:MAG TPA: hypothetical protein VH877_23990 [Polyangia bacterium]|nr:hypothetical protein [Polyangia bacterium]